MVVVLIRVTGHISAVCGITAPTIRLTIIKYLATFSAHIVLGGWAIFICIFAQKRQKLTSITTYNRPTN